MSPYRREEGRRHVAPASRVIAQMLHGEAVISEYRRRLIAAGFAVHGDEVLVSGATENAIASRIWRRLCDELRAKETVR